MRGGARKKPRRFRILLIVALWLTFLFSLVVFCNAANTLTYFLRFYFETVAVELCGLGRYTEDVLMKYKAHSWLLSYWTEHVDELDLPVGAYNNYSGRWYEDHKQFFLVDVESVTEEQIETFSAEDQKLFAEFCYEQIASILASQRVPFPSVLDTVLKCTEKDTQVEVIFQTLPEDSTAKRYPLGEMQEIDLTPLLFFGQDLDIGSLGDGVWFNYYQNGEDVWIRVFQYFGDEEQTEYVIMEEIPVEAQVHILADNLRSVEIMNIAALVTDGILVLVMMYFLAVRPIIRVSGSVREYTNTKDSALARKKLEKIRKKKVRTEAVQLADDVVAMTEDIDRYVAKIEKDAIERQMVAAEMQMATRIQTGQLPAVFPPFPEHPEIDIFAMMDPAKEVGGDFYDFFLIEDSHLALVIADVSDKGVPAALFMMTTKALIQSAVYSGVRLETAMEHVNRQLDRANPEGMFVTVWVAVLELATGKLVSINAGHEKPAIRQKGEAFALDKTPHDMALGSLPDLTFEEHTTQLLAGDMLFVYTDGVTEATDRDGKRFGNERMLKALDQAKTNDPKELIHHVKEEVASFVDGAEQFDDITMLCIIYHGAIKEQEE